MKKIITILCIFFTSMIASAQCMMYPVLLQERIQNSTLVVEGRVIDKVSFWNNQHTKIFTSNLVEVYKSFRNTAPVYIEVITEGGIVNDVMHNIEPSLQLNIDEVGVFTLISNSENTQFGKPVYEAYASAQGFIKYSIRDNMAFEPFKKYENISSNLYDEINSYTQTNFVVIKTQNAFQVTNTQNTVQAVAAITGFSPTTITAGTKSVLTINGSGFGTTINASQIGFRNADDGGGTFISPIATEIVSWTDTEIKVQVPTEAGTGVVRVQGVNSTATLTIPYAHLNTTYGGYNFLSKHINKANSGGYSWVYNANFITNTAAKASFERAFESWRCGTFINWSIASNTSSLSASASDGVNIITFNPSLSAGVLGNCTGYSAGCGAGSTMTWYVSEIDIQFSTVPASGYTWQYGTANPSFSQFDFESVAAHELGHGHQLGHVIKQTALMNFNISNGAAKRNLSTDDLDAGNAIMVRNATAGSTCSNPLMIPLNSTNCSLSTPSISASFNSPTSACINQAVTFTNTSTGSPTSYSWTTTNASVNTSTLTNAIFTFTSAGVKTVTLTATSGTATSTTTKTLTINSIPTVTVNSASICAGTSTVLTASGANTYLWSTNATVASISVTPTSNTNYTVVGTNTFGCSQTQTTSVTIKANPTVVVNSASICAGTPTVLTASGASTYLWNTGITTSSISVSPTANTNYTVVGTNTLGCSQTKTTTVLMNALPSVSVNNATICTGSSATLTASGTVSYSWSTGATSASINVSPIANTTYTVTGKNALGCTQTKTTTVVVSASPNVVVNSASICAGTSTVLTASGANTYTWSNGVTTSTISVTPSVNTTYTVNGKLNGCASVDTQTTSVTIKANPTVVVNSASICAGTPTVLTASGASTYLWNTGITTSSISVSPTANTNYTVVGTNTLGCSQTKTTTVLMNDLPSVSVNNATICTGSSATLTASGTVSYSWSTGATSASINVSPTANTTYTVTGKNALGCTQTKITTVVVSASPNVVVNSASICAGTSTVLAASGANTYTWSNGLTTSTISVTPSVNTTYTVNGKLTGCTSVDTQTTTVIVNQLPNVSLSANNLNVCSNSANVTLVGLPSGGTYSGNGVSANTFSPTSAGVGSHMAIYNFTNGNGCSNSANVTFSVSLCTGMQELLNNEEINVYPIPTTNYLTIELRDEKTEITQVELYDVMGKLMLGLKSELKNSKLDLNEIPRGIYLLRVSTNDFIYVKRIIKE